MTLSYLSRRYSRFFAGFLIANRCAGTDFLRSLDAEVSCLVAVKNSVLLLPELSFGVQRSCERPWMHAIT
jgi:hypothetical protein